MRNYSPKGHYVWDAWAMPRPEDGIVHLYHLQRKRPGVEAPDSIQDQLGHAISRDLIDWEEQPAVFGPDASDPNDDMQPWTGSALWHEGKGYLYYTRRGTRTEGRKQSIGLATSNDGANWQRANPAQIIVPDSRWYATAKAPVPGIVDCRDLVVIPNPKGGWLGFYATRVPGEELPQTSAIACVRSNDLVHWEHLPPAFVPGNNSCIEVPDVFEINGRWFMTCLAGNFYGNRGFWTDPNMVNGTLYAVADQPEGPYRELDDNVLLATRAPGHISCRSVLWQGQRYAMYTDREYADFRDGNPVTTGTLSTPKVVKADGSRLFLGYDSRIESRCTAELIGVERPLRPKSEQQLWGQIWLLPTAQWHWENHAVRGQARTGWGVTVIETGTTPDSFIFEATITLFEGVAAGLALRMENRMSGGIVEINAETQTVAFNAAPAFDWSERRQTPIPLGIPLHLRVVNRLEHIEIYLNDELRLAFARYTGIGGEFGLFVDRGKAQFTDVRLRELKVSRSL